ncbi:hypothetical protein EHQ12_17235 [Leptospira gomenensis]|uniref:Uncharacterized protein n=1 Tax=Leptospira gomenensis TaxID=2484974 RepID=A0A5F1YBP1_9LEPT|nr:hypothetical protein [Leptospira gomenensis]TGK33711.1 hypothetical protein EHQ12_17235 [Leptospira gomenensis]TGK35128.1 hypothetical protein EHQ17_06710 [Leptospira gomenensis]TGK46354.1 hypothetical protein EHQ07_06785 [Leptospira gomenensis]TGK65682.1 hypothetical protein EHQ13_04910 [Leptospira gomenensis]
MGVKSFFGRLFFRFFRKRKPRSATEQTPPVRDSLGYKTELSQLRDKADRFFVTRKKNSGLVHETKFYKLQKNGPKLFRLEGREKGGREYNIVVSTGNFLSLQGDKISGVVFLPEAELNRILSYEHSDLKSVFSRFQPEDIEEDLKLLYGDQTSSGDSWKDVYDWEPFWKQQILVRLKPSVLAVLLVYMGQEFEQFFQSNSTKRLKSIISDELYFLNVSGNQKENSPNTENLSLQDFETAKRQFFRTIEQIRYKRGKTYNGH